MSANAEDAVYSDRYSNNGASPMWCFNNTCVVRVGEDLFACDYRGIGESRPDTCRPDCFLGIYGSDYNYAAHATMLGESVVAWRVHDVLSTLDWMASFGFHEIHLVAQGWGTIPGALAALLDERVRQVTLIHALNSYSELAEAPMQEWPFSAMLPGVLGQFDLPDVYRELTASKTLGVKNERKSRAPDLTGGAAVAGGCHE
jgi:pimeloyl-ACP methyl ester carboxylesterase